MLLVEISCKYYKMCPNCPRLGYHEQVDHEQVELSELSAPVSSLQLQLHFVLIGHPLSSSSSQGCSKFYLCLLSFLTISTFSGHTALPA